MSAASFEVLTSGPLTTIQDLGRPGWAHIGVSQSGAVDQPALRLANRLVENPDGAPALETTLVGPKLLIHGTVTVALAGAPVAARVGDRELPMHAAVELHDGDVLRVGTARRGLRTYVAFAGGLEVPLVMGSASTDVLTGLGPTPLAKGDVLSIGTVGSGVVPSEVGPSHAGQLHPLLRPGIPELPSGGPVVLQVVLGPRDDWFTEAAIEALRTSTFTVTPQSNRVGLRLSGPTLERARSDELLSEGITSGSIQVPPSGSPILLLADHPTTGGYPVIATLHSDSLPLAGQLRPGQELRFSI